MDPKKTSAIALAAALAGAGIGRATVPAAPPPKFERICVEADGSAQFYLDKDGHKLQVLIPTDHAQAPMLRTGGKFSDVVPPGLSKAIKAVVVEGGNAAAAAKSEKK